MHNKKKVIVTGGAGFIGSHIVDELLKKGFDVHIIDNLSNGKIENINKKAKFYNLDIRNLKSILPFFRNTVYVFHLAALPRVQYSIENPIETNEVNIDGTLNIFEASRLNKVKRVIYSASSSAYGDQKKLPLVESMYPNPKSPYGMQKLVGEFYAKVWSEVYKLETVSLRYFNVYGPRQSSDGSYPLVIAKFIDLKSKNLPLTITGTGKQTRDFTHVKDVVSANILAMKSKKVGKGEIINIGAGDNHSIIKIAKIIGGEIKNIKPRIEPRDTKASNLLAKKLLGWQPRIKIESGIKELLNNQEKIEDRG